MSRIATLAISFILGCASPPRLAIPPPPEVSSSGITFYVIEAHDDILDDLWPNPLESPKATRWMGEQALRMALRAVSVRRVATLARQERAELREGELVEFVPNTPVHHFRRGHDGRYQLEMHGEPAGFGLRLRAEIFEHKYVRVEHDLRLIRPELEKLEGTDLEAGPPRLVEDRIGKETITFPIGATMVLSVPRGGSRIYLVLVHVVSIESSRR